MSKKENREIPELDIAGLLALKAYERPAADHVEKKIQNIMREVRTAHKKPSLLLFPDKSFAWMFTQPRYGVAALFILFLGLHLLERPVPAVPVADTSVSFEAEPVADVSIASMPTNHPRVPASAVFPKMAPAYRPVPNDLATFVDYK